MSGYELGSAETTALWLEIKCRPGLRRVQHCGEGERCIHIAFFPTYPVLIYWLTLPLGPVLSWYCHTSVNVVDYRNSKSWVNLLKRCVNVHCLLHLEATENMTNVDVFKQAGDMVGIHLQISTKLFGVIFIFLWNIFILWGVVSESYAMIFTVCMIKKIFNLFLNCNCFLIQMDGSRWLPGKETDRVKILKLVFFNGISFHPDD